MKSCAEAGCHAEWRSVAFHVGRAHRDVASRCETCHQPHSARVDASDCTGCHQSVREGGGKIQPPMPFDTTEALRSSTRLIEPGRARGQGDAPPPDISARFPADTFSHERHRRLACLTCHTTTSRTATLTFEPPRGCQICHHQRPARSGCAACHQAEEIAPTRQVTVQVTVPREDPRPREVGFAHEAHDEIACVKCHTQPVSLEPEPAAATCAACHDDHHVARRDCATCHRTDQVMDAHRPPVDAHGGCDQCHTSTTIAVLEPTRSFCLACHPSEVDHHRQRECSTCHLQAEPDGYRPRLTGASP